jgi:ribosomal protein S20
MQIVNIGRIRRMTELMWGPDVAAKQKAKAVKAADTVKLDDPRVSWNEQDYQVMRDHYATMPWDQLEALLPGKTYDAIQRKASRMGIKRVRKGEPLTRKQVITALIKKAYESIENLDTQTALTALDEASRLVDEIGRSGARNKP